MTVEGDGDDDDVVSKNGFTRELAESYVDSIIESIKFAEKDKVIKRVLTEKGIPTLPAEDSCDDHATLGQDQEPPLSLVIEGTAPTSVAATDTRAANLPASSTLDSKV